MFSFLKRYSHLGRKGKQVWVRKGVNIRSGENVMFELVKEGEYVHSQTSLLNVHLSSTEAVHQRTPASSNP